MSQIIFLKSLDGPEINHAITGLAVYLSKDSIDDGITISYRDFSLTAECSASDNRNITY